MSQIVRDRVFSSRYWKEKCFALNAESLLDNAKVLDSLGFCYGGYSRPTSFLCLLVKLLQIKPSAEIVRAYLDFSDGKPTNDPIQQARDLRYMRALAAVYIRMVCSPQYVFRLLEPLLKDYRKLNVLDNAGRFSTLRMDEFISMLLDEENSSLYGLHLTTFPRRKTLEERGLLDAYPRELPS